MLTTCTCGKPFNALLCSSNSETPIAGDISVCLYCAAAYVFMPGGRGLRPMTESDLQTLTPDERRAFDDAKAAARTGELAPVVRQLFDERDRGVDPIKN